jgi:hypothetical protein
MANFIHIYQSISLSLPSQFVECLSSPSFHNISSWDPSSALDTLHFLNTLTVTSGKIDWYAMMIHSQRRVTLGFLIPHGLMVDPLPRAIDSMPAKVAFEWFIYYNI